MRFEKKYLIAVVIIIIVVIIGFISLGNSPDISIDTKPEGSGIDFSTHANIVGGEELVQQIGSLDGFESLSQDIHTFGRVAYDSYKKDLNRVVGFKVKKTTKDGSTIRLEGSYGSSVNTIKITVEILNNNRIRTNITDQETLLNIDSLLPSNTTINAFIGTLPINKERYILNYVAPSGVEITLYERDDALYQEAYQDLSERLGDVIKEVSISVSFPTAGFSEE